MTFRLTVLAVEDGSLIRWRGRLGMPGLFDGEHELRLEPTSDGGGTRFVSGPLHLCSSGATSPRNSLGSASCRRWTPR